MTELNALIFRGDVFVHIIHYFLYSDTQWCLTLHDLMECSPLPPPAPWIFQARILEQVPFPPPGDLLDLEIEPPSLKSPELAGGFFTTSTIYISRKLVMNPRLLKYSLVNVPYISSETCVSFFPMGVMLDVLDRGFSFWES